MDLFFRNIFALHFFLDLDLFYFSFRAFSCERYFFVSVILTLFLCHSLFSGVASNCVLCISYMFKPLLQTSSIYTYTNVIKLWLTTLLTILVTQIC